MFTVALTLRVATTRIASSTTGSISGVASLNGGSVRGGPVCVPVVAAVCVAVAAAEATADTHRGRNHGRQQGLAPDPTGGLPPHPVGTSTTLLGGGGCCKLGRPLAIQD